MKRYLKAILYHPATHFNILSVGVLIMIGMLHNHAHHSMEVDADSYVFNWCRNNPEKCKEFMNR
tara:strand:- start:187 stop:378 length:192 start_codon:yes stop_codon:yes gene_type:complete